MPCISLSSSAAFAALSSRSQYLHGVTWPENRCLSPACLGQRARRAVIGRTSAARSSEATGEGGLTSEEKKHSDGLTGCNCRAALSGCCGIVVGDHRPLIRPGVPDYPAVKPKEATAGRGVHASPHPTIFRVELPCALAAFKSCQNDRRDEQNERI